jgi:hypothetical protein
VKKSGSDSRAFANVRLLAMITIAILPAALGTARALMKNSGGEQVNNTNPSSSDAEVKQHRTVRMEAKELADDLSALFRPAQEPKAKVPVLTLQNAPNVPQCHGILRQEILDLVNAATDDPAETFEKNRRLHPHMIEMPPTLECASKLWLAVRRNGAAQPPADPGAINRRQYSLESVFLPGGLTAAVGTNIDPSNGVENYQGENNVAIDPNNPQHIIAHSNTFFKDTTAQCQSPTGGTASTFGTMALFGSSDGGVTWKYNCAPWHTSATGGVTGAVAWFGSDPALAWDNQGRAYACYMLISENSSGSAFGASIVLARSTDNGQTWSQFGNPVVNNVASTAHADDKEMMVIDNTSGQAHSFSGRIYVIWDDANAERIAHSDDGVTWSTVTPSSNTGAIGGNLAIAPDGTVYAIWTRYNVETIVFTKSTDGGATWTAPAVISTNALQSFGSNNLPPAQDTRGINGFGAIDVDRNPNSAFFGNIYVSFTDFPSGISTGADLNAYMIRSINGGTTWSTRIKVNDDNFGASQFFPWLAVDQSDGTVNMSWIDSRIDPINRKTQMVYARSIDGGVSFEPNILVNDNGANWRNNVNYSDENTADNTSYNGNQYGDYSGIAAFNRQVHPLWTDSRMFFPLADTHSPTRREDNGTSTITNCSAPSTVAAPTVNSSTTPSGAVSWAAPAGWGTNATNGTYSVYRNTTSTFPAGSPLASGLASTNYVDTTGVNGTTYFYFVRAKNNCPGTALTPMTADSVASASVVFGSAGTPTGALQGTVASGGSPVSDVVVNAGTFSATTNGSGFYQFTAINANTYTVSSSPAGYNSASVSGVVVTSGGTTVQNLSLTPISSNGCFTDTSFADFSTGSGTNVDIASSPADVKLALVGPEAVDQSNTPGSLFNAGNITSTQFLAQTFTTGATGNLTKAVFALGLATGGTSGTVLVELHNTVSGAPGTTVLASAVMGPVTNVGTAAVYSVTFSSPAPVTSGTVYALLLKPNAGSTAFGVRGGTNAYSGGAFYLSTNSGSTWTAQTTDLYFQDYVTPTSFKTSGNFVSSIKDSGAVVGATPTWSTLSWNNPALPSGTSIQFQAAASNSSSGPFNFVGPDGTSGTFFTNGASLAQFNGLRYLKYKALLNTTNSTVTPTLTDVTICFTDLPPLRIDTIAPRAGRTSGGQQIRLTGAFAGLSTVTMGGSSASWFYTNGSGDTSAITVTTPAHAVGAVQIDLTPTSGSVYSKANAFAYLPTVFTDDTITIGQTTSKAQHIIELRQAVDAMRVVAGLSGAPWTDPALAQGNPIRAIHILDLRSFLDDAATRLGYSTSPYTDPGLTLGFVIKRIHIEELRQRIRTIAG